MRSSLCFPFHRGALFFISFLFQVDKEEIELYAQLPIREALAQKCFQVAQFTEVFLIVSLLVIVTAFKGESH